jgi:hypothetical protein
MTCTFQIAIGAPIGGGIGREGRGRNAAKDGVTLAVLRRMLDQIC